MGVREILEFVKVEHTLFSLPFVLIGFMLADHSFGSETMDITWIVLAAVGARGLAMALNRIVDRDIDADNPRTASRHLPSGTMSIGTAWILAVVFLSTLLFSAWRLNKVALMMSWLPVLAFAIYPYTKRFSWICHFWIGLCLALAPAGAWLAIAADTHGWESITGLIGTESRFLWFPEAPRFQPRPDDPRFQEPSGTGFDRTRNHARTHLSGQEDGRSLRRQEDHHPRPHHPQGGQRPQPAGGQRLRTGQTRRSAQHPARGAGGCQACQRR